MIGKKLRLVTKIIKSKSFRLKFPCRLIFAVTYKCNLRCRTCFIWSKERQAELTLEEIDLFFQKSNRFSWIDLTGGEIFLRPDISDVFRVILHRCRNLCLLHFPTNGQLPEKILSTTKEIIKHDKAILTITVSMDGPELINNNIRGDNEAWGKSLESFVKLKELGLRYVYLGYTVSPYNVGRLEEMFNSVKRFYPGITFNDIHLNIAHKSKHYFNNDSVDLTLNYHMTNDIMYFLDKKRRNGMKKFLENRYLKLALKYISTKIMPTKCQSMSSSCFIDPYGDIYPCSIFDNKFANIRDINYDLSFLWKQKNIKNFVKENPNNKCGGCWTPCEAYLAML